MSTDRTTGGTAIPGCALSALLILLLVTPSRHKLSPDEIEILKHEAERNLTGANILNKADRAGMAVLLLSVIVIALVNLG